MKKLPKFKSKSLLGRVYLLNFLFLAANQILLGRLFFLQVKQHSEWLAKAASQHQVVETISPERGEIYFKSKDGALQTAATDKDFVFIYAVPKEIAKAGDVSVALGHLLDIPPETLYKKLSKKGDPYEMVMRKVPPEIINQIKALNFKGIYIDRERGRFYPAGKLASQVVGFVGSGSTDQISGRYGIESKYDDILQGKGTESQALRDASGKILFSFASGNSKPGSTLILTIDPQIQFEAERLLGEYVKKWQAKSGNIIVMEPSTGRILALANDPTFDPNTYAKEKGLQVFLNPAVSTRYEPGSVFKAFTMAAGLESGAVTPDTTYYDSGELHIGPNVIRNAGNSAPKKQITMTRVLERSYNLGAVFVEMQVGADRFKQFLLDRFGFEKRTDVDLPSEINSNFSNLKPPEGRTINFATAAFGQGIAVTPLKLAQVFAALANNGTMMKPYVVEEIQQNGVSVKKTKPQAIGQIVSQETIKKLTPMLEAVVEGDLGSGKLARIPGYYIAGKTGTGEVPIPNGHGYSNRVNHTFAGFGPTSNPKVLIVTRLEEPLGVRYAESTAVPLFHDLMKFILQYYEIPPDHPEELVAKRSGQ